MDWTIRSEKHEAELVDQLSRCAYAIGLCLGDGYLQSYRAQKNGKWYPLQVVRFGNMDRDSIEAAAEAIKNVFGVKYAVLPRTLASGTPYFQLHAYRRDIFDFFAINTAMRMKIPEPFFIASNEAKKELIAGLMDSDGYVSHREFETYERWAVGFANTNRDMVAGLAAILQSLGVKVGTIGTTQKGEYRLMYRIAPNVRSFVEAGCYFRASRKQKKLTDAVSYMLGSETLYAAPSSRGDDKVQQTVKAA